MTSSEPKQTSTSCKKPADEELRQIKEELAESRKKLEIELTHLNRKYNFLENIVRNRKSASMHRTGNQMQDSEYSVLLPKTTSLERCVRNAIDLQPKHQDQSVCPITIPHNNATIVPPCRTLRDLCIATRMPEKRSGALDLSQTIDAGRSAECPTPLSSIGTTIEARSRSSCTDTAMCTQSKPEHYQTTYTSHSKENVPTQTNASSHPLPFTSVDVNKNHTLLRLRLYSNTGEPDLVGATQQQGQLLQFAQRFDSSKISCIQTGQPFERGSMQQMLQTPARWIESASFGSLRPTADTMINLMDVLRNNGLPTPSTCNAKIDCIFKEPQWLSKSEHGCKLMNSQSFVRRGCIFPDATPTTEWSQLESISTWDPGRSVRTKVNRPVVGLPGGSVTRGKR